MRQKARQPLLLAALGAALYGLPYADLSDELALIGLFVLLGLPMLVGALLRSAIVLAVPVLVGVLLLLSPFLGVGEDSELWSDPLSGLAVVIAMILEFASAAVGMAVGHTLARWRHRP